jgi:putative transposase
LQKGKALAKKGEVGQIKLMTKPTIIYPTDLNDTEWSQIEQYMPAKKTTGRPMIYSWREILNGLFYMVKNGCVWRAMPKDLPPWQTLYGYFRKFQKSGLWEKLDQVFCQLLRQRVYHKEATASLMILDSQSVKSAEGGEERGFDGFKKVVGRKRNLVVDNLGLLVLAKVTAANVQDVYAGKKTLEELKQRPHLLNRLKKIIADGSYRGDLERWVQEELHVVLEIVLKLGGKTGFQVLPKRWVIERSNAWLSRHRRLARDYERRVVTDEAFIYIAMLRICLRRLARSESF